MRREEGRLHQAPPAPRGCSQTWQLPGKPGQNSWSPRGRGAWSWRTRGGTARATGTRRGAAWFGQSGAPGTGEAQPPGLAGDEVQIWSLAPNPGCPPVPPSSPVLLLHPEPTAKEQDPALGVLEENRAAQVCRHLLQPAELLGARPPARARGQREEGRRLPCPRSASPWLESQVPGYRDPLLGYHDTFPTKGTDHHRLLPEAQHWLRTPDSHVTKRTCPRMPEYF